MVNVFPDCATMLIALPFLPGTLPPVLKANNAGAASKSYVAAALPTTVPAPTSTALVAAPYAFCKLLPLFYKNSFCGHIYDIT